MKKIRHLGQGRIFVESGVLMEDLLNFCAKKGLLGFEWAGGLPGTVGGAIKGNAGAFGKEIKDLVEIVHSLKSNNDFEEISRKNKDCKFSYRNSIFKEKKEIVLSSIFKLKPGFSPKELKKEIREKINYRINRHPLEFPNTGSIFKNCDLKKIPKSYHKSFKDVIKQDPFPVVPTAYLIFQCGLKGKRQGDVKISEKHPNFIINLGDGKAKDVKKLIELIKKRVKRKFKIDLEEEIQYLGF